MRLAPSQKVFSSARIMHSVGSRAKVESWMNCRTRLRIWEIGTDKSYGSSSSSFTSSSVLPCPSSGRTRDIDSMTALVHSFDLGSGVVSYVSW